PLHLPGESEFFHFQRCCRVVRLPAAAGFGPSAASNRTSPVTAAGCAPFAASNRTSPVTAAGCALFAASNRTSPVTAAGCALFAASNRTSPVTAAVFRPAWHHASEFFRLRRRFRHAQPP